MAQAFIGEIRLFAGNFPPQDWAFCDGALLPIADNQALFALIGTTYGGDGQTTFALPDLRGRIPLHSGAGAGGNYVIGQGAGAETVALNANQIPAHTHTLACQEAGGTQPSPAGGVWAASSLNQYSASAPSAAMSPNAIGAAGGSQPHDNLMPYLAVNFIISLFGIFPSQQ